MHRTAADYDPNKFNRPAGILRDDGRGRTDDRNWTASIGIGIEPVSAQIDGG